MIRVRLVNVVHRLIEHQPRPQGLHSSWKKNFFSPLSLTSKRCAVKQGNFRVRIFFFLPIQLAYKKSPNYSNFEFSSKFFTPIGIIHFIFLIVENFKNRTIFSIIILLKKSAFQFNIGFVFCILLPHVPNSF